MGGFRDKIKIITHASNLVAFFLALVVPGLLAGNPLHILGEKVGSIVWVTICTWPLTGALTLIAASLARGWKPGYGAFIFWLGLCLFVPAYFGISLGLERSVSIQEMVERVTAPGMPKNITVLFTIPPMLLGWYCELYGVASFVASILVSLFYGFAASVLSDKQQ